MFGAGDGNYGNFNASNVSLSYNKDFSDKISLNVKYQFSYDNHFVNNNFYYKRAYTVNLNSFKTHEAEVLADIKPTNMGTLIGINGSSTQDSYTLADYPSFNVRNIEFYFSQINDISIFSQIDYTFFDRFKVIASFRLEKPLPYDISIYFRNTDTTTNYVDPPTKLSYMYKPVNYANLIPRLAAIYSINNNSIKLLYGKAIKQPSSSSNSIMIFSNQDEILKPSEIQTYELNYIGNISKNYIINISLFRNELKNLITRVNILDPNEGVIVGTANTGKLETKGLEIGIQSELFYKLNIDLSFTYQQSKNRDC